MFLLDTNACLDFLLLRHAGVPARVRREYGRLNVSMITVAELRVGGKLSSDPIGDEQRLDSFLTFVDPHAFDASAALIYGDLVRRVGVKRQSFDRLIAAHALALKLTLVTGNGADFADVPGLVMENWR